MSRTLKECLAAAILVLAVAAPGLAQSGGKPAEKAPRTKSKTVKPAKDASPFPSFETRRADWIRRKEASAASGAAGPDPLEQYLVSEVVVTGLFETENGYGVFLLAKPTGNTFFVSSGAKLYNGRLVAIEPAGGSFADDAQIVFSERAGKSGDRRVVKRVEAAPSREPEPEAEPAAPPPAPTATPPAKPATKPGAESARSGHRATIRTPRHPGGHGVLTDGQRMGSIEPC